MRQKDTINSKAGKKRLQKELPHHVTQFLEAIDRAYKEGRWDDYFKGIDIYLSRTVPKLSNVEYTADDTKLKDQLNKLLKLKRKQPSDVTITTIDTKQLESEKNEG